MTAPDGSSTVPFAFFCSLVNAIASIRPTKTNSSVRRANNNLKPTALQTFEKWVSELHRRYSPLPCSTTAIIFRFLFPDRDIARKYGMQEAKLAQYLLDILGVSSLPDGRGERLRKWQGEDAQGCLGFEVHTILESSYSTADSDVTIVEIDDLLTRLAAKCAFSDASVRQHYLRAAPSPIADSRRHLLRKLYTDMTPLEASVLTQIMMKDLRPLLYPVPQDAGHYSTALLEYSSRSYSELTLPEAMRVWDPSGRMLQAFQVRSSIEEAANAYEQPHDRQPLRPQVGRPIQIPKCVKGQGCADVLRHFRNSKKIWVETKYDGERAQIHVELPSDDGHPSIRIFSKSGRESTLDRAAIHSVICEALGMGSVRGGAQDSTTRPGMRRVSKNVVLEAEMVAFSDTLKRVDEFWRIRSLIASTAIGVRHRALQSPGTDDETSGNSQDSMVSNASDGGTRHLALVFFDILLLDDEPLLSSPYSTRRHVLESVVQLAPGSAMLSERVHIDLRSEDAERTLRTVFSRLIADHQEGAVLKADDARHNDWRNPWIKLKRDYIPGYGDALDLVLLGATWEKDRARELLVPPAACTTFYLGALTNAEELKETPTVQPHFEVLFTVSYGLSRDKLEELNFIIKSSNPIPLASCVSSGLSYKFTIVPGLPPPAVLLGEPVLAEVFGAGFTKAPSSKCYELRFPRISKIYRCSERSWVEGTTRSDLQRIGRESVGRERPNKDVDDWCSNLWGKSSSPSTKCPMKRKRTETLWERKLELVDMKENGKKRAMLAASPITAMRKTLRREQDLVNVVEENVEPTRSAKKLRNFMPVTNTANSATTRPPLLLHDQSPETPGPSARFKGSNSHVVQRAQFVHALASVPSLSPVVADEHAPLYDNAPQTAVNTTASQKGHRILHIPAITNTPHAQTSGTSLADFLTNAVVWLARPQTSPRPIRRAPSHLAFPDGHLVHGLDAFLRACGWSDSDEGSCPWAIRGVVFVDDIREGCGDAWTEHPIKILVSKRAALVAAGAANRCKPVSVFSIAMLNLGRLQVNYVDIQNEAIFKLG